MLGTTGRLLGPDTAHFVLRYEPRTQLNRFLLVRASDTVPWFAARAFQYRGLYYLVTPGRDSISNWVHAVRITPRSVQGLGTAYHQMQDLSAAVEGGQFAELIQFRSFSSASIVLRFEKAALHRFYRTLPDSFPVYRLASASIAQAPGIIPGYNPPKDSISIFPNPATQVVTVAFAAPAPRTIHILDNTGRELRRATCTTAATTLSLDQLTAGSYLIRVTPARGAAKRSYRLTVVQ